MSTRLLRATLANDKEIRMISRRSFSILGLSLTFSGPLLASGQTEWKVGEHYVELTPPLPKQSNSDKVEVIEFFWYGCPRCYTTEPHLVLWEKKKPSDVDFLHVPVMLGAERRMAHGRLYYVLNSLHREDLHGQVFDAIHRARDPLESFSEQLKFTQGHGIDPKEFERAYKSADLAMQGAEKLAKSYRIDGVPALAINGKYVTTLRRAGSEASLIVIVDALIDRERYRKSGPSKS